MPTAHCVATMDGVIVAVDHGFIDLVRRPEADLIGASYRTITHPADLARSAGMLAALVDRAAPVRLQKRYLRADGSAMATNLLVSRFDDSDRLVATLFWNEAGRELPPARLWRAALRVRHVHDVRRAQFGGDIGGDPVGSLLLSVYLAEAEGRVVGIARLAQETGLSSDLALRWIKALQQRGVIQADADLAADVPLTPAGTAKMEATLAAVYHIPS